MRRGTPRTPCAHTRLKPRCGRRGLADVPSAGQTPKAQQAGVEANGLYLFGTQKEEWSWNSEQPRQLNDQGRPIANVAAMTSGLRARDAPSEQAGGLARKTYISNGAPCIATNPVMQECGPYNGAVGEVADIVARGGDRPPSSPPSCVVGWFPKYYGPVFLDKDPVVVPIFPIVRVLDSRCARAMIPIAPTWGITFRKSQEATCGAGGDAESVAAHASALSFVKPRPIGLYLARPREKSAGRGVYGDPNYEPSSL